MRLWTETGYVVLTSHATHLNLFVIPQPIPRSLLLEVAIDFFEKRFNLLVYSQYC